MARFCFAVLLSLGSIVCFASAWPIAEIMRGNTIDTNFLNSETSRRHFVLASAFSVALIPSRAQASPKLSEALEEMRESKEKLQAIPDLLEEKEWDKVRTILKLPPVNKLWNLGDVRLFLQIFASCGSIFRSHISFIYESTVPKYCTGIGKRNWQHRFV